MLIRVLSKTEMAKYSTRLVTKKVNDLIEAYNDVLLAIDDFDIKLSFGERDETSFISSNKISDITGSAVTTKESLKSLVNIFEKRMEYVKKLFTEDEKLIFEYSIEKQRPDLYVQNIVKKYDKTFYSLKKSCYLKIYIYFKLDENSYFLKK